MPAVRSAQAKVAALQVARKNQVNLIAFTKTALNKCSDFSAAALFTAGASVAVCVAEQPTCSPRPIERGSLGAHLNATAQERDLAARRQAS